MTAKEKKEFYNALESAAYHYVLNELRTETYDRLGIECPGAYAERHRVTEQRYSALRHLALVLDLREIVDRSYDVAHDSAWYVWSQSKSNPENGRA